MVFNFIYNNRPVSFEFFFSCVMFFFYFSFSNKSKNYVPVNRTNKKKLCFSVDILFLLKTDWNQKTNDIFMVCIHFLSMENPFVYLFCLIENEDKKFLLTHIFFYYHFISHKNLFLLFSFCFKIKEFGM